MSLFSSVGSMLRGSLLLVLIEGVEKASTFLKSVIVARLIGPEEFGVASLFVITIALFEMMSGFSPDVLMVQDDQGDEERMQSSIHAFQLIRGALLALFLFLSADLIATMFNVPDASWAFRILAFAPLLTGLSHLDLKRLQRTLNFSLLAKVTILSSVTLTALTFPIAFYLRNYAAMLWIIILQSALLCVLSHLVAERSYSLKIDLAVFKKIFFFGWPLLLNGLLIFGIFQGDRVIIGAFETFSLRDLGVYSVAFSLTMVPALSYSRILNTLFLPLLSRHRPHMDSFKSWFSLASQITVLASSSYAFIFILLGGLIVPLVYGDRYTGATEFIGWLAAMQAVRILRSSPTTTAISQGDTRTPLYANVARTCAVPLAVYCAASGFQLKWIAVAGFVGECLALGVLLFRLRSTVDLGDFMAPAVVAAASTCLALFINGFRGFLDGWFVVSVSLTLNVIAVMVLYWMFPSFRNNARSFTHGLRPGTILTRQ